mmetsp:Transcript_104653/g.249162  ORF Transcript_104653/g.249162 Transcript_104653/m.249162 type:complete len:202 (-) Transcript_104653:1422-2027(-)
MAATTATIGVSAWFTRPTLAVSLMGSFVNVGGRISADRNGLSLIRSFSMVWHCKKVVWHGNKRQSRWCRNWISPEKRNCSRRIVNTCSIGRSQKKSWIGMGSTPSYARRRAGTKQCWFSPTSSVTRSFLRSAGDCPKNFGSPKVAVTACTGWMICAESTSLFSQRARSTSCPWKQLDTGDALRCRMAAQAAFPATMGPARP